MRVGTGSAAPNPGAIPPQGPRVRVLSVRLGNGPSAGHEDGQMALKRMLGGAVTAAMLVVATAGAASAGEVTGNGQPIEVHGASICAYSGLDDVDEGEDPDDPSTDDFGRTQNFGQIARFVQGPMGGAGGACRPGAGH